VRGFGRNTKFSSNVSPGSKEVEVSTTAVIKATTEGREGWQRQEKEGAVGSSTGETPAGKEMWLRGPYRGGERRTGGAENVFKRHIRFVRPAVPGEGARGEVMPKQAQEWDSLRRQCGNGKVVEKS